MYDGTCVVVDGGPGTGKTTTLIQRLKYLISELEAYYESVKWRKDFESDKAGLLPKNLKRGVLSEDGINDLLDEYKEVSE